MKVSMWLIIVLSVLLIGFFYIGWRIITPLKFSQPYTFVSWIVLFLIFMILPLAMFLLRSGYEEWNHRFAWLIYVTMGFLSFVFTFLVIKDILWLFGIGGEKLYSWIRSLSSTSAASTQIDAERRLFLTNVLNIGVLGLASGFTAYGIFEARRKPSIKEIEVPLRNLPVEFHGFNIVQISDVHAGLTVKRDFVQTIVDMVMELRPDLIAFTGDMVDGSVPHLREHVEPLSSLDAPYGKYFVTGNHEYYSGVMPWVEEAKRLGFKVLLNEHNVIERGNGKILLAGVTDYTGGQFLKSHISDPGVALFNAPPCDTKILLAHQPKSLAAALPHNYNLMISGHTHGGQFFPWNLAAAAGQPYIEGLHNHQGMWVYVSRGTGYWGPPVRVAARSEITVLKLVKA